LEGRAVWEPAGVHGVPAANLSREDTTTGPFHQEIQNMNDLLLLGLQDIYYAENQIVKALPKLIDKATSRDLTKGLKDHLEETKNQIERLDQAFESSAKSPGASNVLPSTC
jgi:hypothetical protein